MRLIKSKLLIQLGKLRVTLRELLAVLLFLRVLLQSLPFFDVLLATTTLFFVALYR